MNYCTYRAEWSPEHGGEYVGRCVELRSLSRRAPTAHQAIAAVTHAVDEYIAELDACGEQPLTERYYSGNFSVRTSPALHRRSR